MIGNIRVYFFFIFSFCFFFVLPLDKLRAHHVLQGPNFTQINELNLPLGSPGEENTWPNPWGAAPHGALAGAPLFKEDRRQMRRLLRLMVFRGLASH